MSRLAAGALVVPLLFSGTTPGIGATPGVQPVTCKPSRTVLKAIATPVRGLTSQQVTTATAIINAGAQLHVTERGQTIAVMTALEGSSRGNPGGSQSGGAGSPGLFGPD